MAQPTAQEMEGMVTTVGQAMFAAGQAMFEAKMMRGGVAEVEADAENCRESLVNQEVRAAEDRKEGENVIREVKEMSETWKKDAKAAKGEWEAWYEWYMEGGKRWVRLGEEAEAGRQERDLLSR